MARHRDIRNMDYEDEYDGYDDIYGHSVDDDYYLSPSNTQFIYNRETSRDSRLEHEEDIQEVDEIDELSDTERAKLHSCIDQIKGMLGPDSIPKSELVALILKYNFNVELVLNAILEDSRYEASAGPKEKDVLFIKTLSNSKLHTDQTAYKIDHKGTNIPVRPKGFVIPDVFGTKMPENNAQTQIFDSSIGGKVNKIFNIPNIFQNVSEKIDFGIPNSTSESNSSLSNSKNFTIPNILSNTPKATRLEDNNENFTTLSELVSSHLKSTVSADQVDGIATKVSDIQLLEHPKEIKSLTSNYINFDIDLSKALKTTTSLPNFPKNKENVSERFHIPFIDGDLISEKNTKKSLFIKRQVLPCVLNIDRTLNFNSNMAKKRSSFAKVIYRKFRHVRAGHFDSLLPMRYPLPKGVKEFCFNTQSPDDYITSHLKRSQAIHTQIQQKALDLV